MWANETRPSETGRTTTRAPAARLPFFEVDGNPTFGVRVAKAAGSDLLVTWSDEVAARGDDCIIYRIWAPPGRTPSSRSQYVLLGQVGEPSYVHVGALDDSLDWDYLIVAYSLSAGEGEWGFGLDSTGLIPS